ncbi:hypothetical protein Q5H92_22040 [Hymenobacter sp. M29]|uniref:Uncharacterized protein n=1 Tax=Hymenobacter mellowenesis TaxID=3063995 RepID=A0ABT9AGU9_9BACT|nr:hypothetical protein [Hymenobacter sp. M29]MDO7849061.1 hypothetical protein [Hymenobacter sp. M29]
MRKILGFSVLLLVASFSAFAQAAPARVAAIQYEHCMLIVRGEHFSSAGSGMELDYGQQAKDGTPNSEMQQASTAIGKLKSVIAALNYLSSQGWECVGFNSIISKVASGSGYTDAQTGYLMRRPK